MNATATQVESPGATPGAEILADLDREANAARAAVQARPSDSTAQVAAARALFHAADARLQLAVCAWLDAHPQAEIEAVLDADDRLEREVREPIASLCSAGLEAARTALAANPRERGARLYVALHLSLLAWAEGTASALVSGRGPRVAGAIADALVFETGPEACSTLRLAGRFHTRAPWPYRDIERAHRELEGARACDASTVNALFSGDAAWWDGNAPAARAAWEAALTAAESLDDPARDALYRELAHRRLQALARAGG